ncbi:MAG: tyrosine-type recombinase/integrase [Janthinobacterium lividum]
MATTYALVLRPPRQRDGLCPVHLRLTSERQPIYRVVPDVALSAKHWNEAGTLEKHNWVRKTHPYVDNVNETLRKLMRQVQKLLDDNPSWSAQQLRVALDGSSADDFLAYLRLDVDRRRAVGHPRTAEKFWGIHNKLQSFRLGIPHPKGRGALANEPDELKARRAATTLPFAQLTPSLIRQYEQYLVGLGNRQTTVQKELSFIKTVVLLAIDEDKLPLDKNPFRRLKLREAKPRVKAKLSDAEVAALEALGPEQLSPAQLAARDTWLLQYYLLGSRIGDALTLRWRDVHETEIEFTEHKTGKQKIAPRHAGLDAVLARYPCPGPDSFVLPYLDARPPYAQFPAGLTWAELARLPAYRTKWLALLPHVESATASINNNLKAAARTAGVAKHLTTHTARHSFADRGRRLGIATADMRDMLNHHSISQTEEYYGELERAELSQKAVSIYAQPAKDVKPA